MFAVHRLIGANGHMAIVAALKNIPNGAGSGTSPVSVTVNNVVGQYGAGALPASGAYVVVVSPSQACAVSVTDKTVSGFTVTLTPLSGSIAVGTFDCLIHT